MPVLDTVKARKVAHLLNELPLPANQFNATVELRADSLNRTTQFESVFKSENLCFKTPTSSDKVYVYVGDAEFMNAQRFPMNETLIIVPLSTKNFTMAGE